MATEADVQAEATTQWPPERPKYIEMLLAKALDMDLGIGRRPNAAPAGLRSESALFGFTPGPQTTTDDRPHGNIDLFVVRIDQRRLTSASREAITPSWMLFSAWAVKGRAR